MMTKATEKDDAGWGCAYALLMVLLLPATISLRGWVLSLLWGWFVAPLFGLPALTFLHAAGLMCFAAYVVPTRVDDTKGKTVHETFWSAVMVGFAGPLFSLGIGWVLSRFLP